MFENPRRGRQARNFTTNAPKTLDLKSSSQQIFSRKLPLGAPVILIADGWSSLKTQRFLSGKQFILIFLLIDYLMVSSTVFTVLIDEDLTGSEPKSKVKKNH